MHVAELVVRPVLLGVLGILTPAPGRPTHVVLLRDTSGAHLADGRQAVLDALNASFDGLSSRGAHAPRIASFPPF